MQKTRNHDEQAPNDEQTRNDQQTKSDGQTRSEQQTQIDGQPQNGTRAQDGTQPQHGAHTQDGTQPQNGVHANVGATQNGDIARSGGPTEDSAHAPTDPGTTFQELVKHEGLRQALDDLGWTRPTPIQVKAIPPAAAGRDLVGIAQTGTGKTGAFLLPTLERQAGSEGLRMLILCPTRELAQQVAADARELAKHAELWVGEVYGGVPIGPQIRDLRAGFDVLVATPGRLIDHLERGTADLSGIEVLILDEADRMLDMGFRPQIDAILRFCPSNRQTMLFSATMPNGVHALALRIMRDPEWVEAVPRATTADGVEQLLYPVRRERKADLLLELLAEEGMDQVLVFTRTKRGADLALSRLQAAKVNAAVLHGDRDMRQRKQALESFVVGKVRVLVATDVAQRGLDIDGISHVINYDVPQNAEDYVHRVGRTARAGATGMAVTFMSAAEIAEVHSIERMLGRRLPRISREGYDYAGSSVEPSAPKTKRQPGRRGGFGAKHADQLSPEELQELLEVG